MIGRRTRAIETAAAALAAAALVAACGSSGSTQSHPSAPTTTHTSPTHEAARVIGTPSARNSKVKYGGVPKWIPRSHVRVGRVVSASPRHPWLAIEGDTVDVRLRSGQTMMTSVGPDVPKQGRFPVPKTSACRFVVTFAAVHGSIPIGPHAFEFLSEARLITGARVTRVGGGTLPSRIRTGHPVSLNVSAVLPTGNGQLRWTPVGHRPTVSWDFDVEID